MSHRTRLRPVVNAALTSVLALVSLTACNEVERAVDNITTAIDVIAQAPTQWEQTLRGLIDDLSDLESDVVDDVEFLLTSAVGQAENAVMCTTDFFGHRVEESLASIRHDLDDSYAEPEIVPVVCAANPSDKVTPGRDAQVVYYGYDFDRFADRGDFTARLQYGDGTVVEEPFGHWYRTTNYQMGVEFQAADFSAVDRTRHPELVLAWQNRDVQVDTSGSATLPVIFNQPPPLEYGVERFEVQFHVGSEWSTHCAPRTEDYRLGGDWRVDRSRGDDSHLGLHEVRLDLNAPGRNVRAYNYKIVDDTQVRVTAELCAEPRYGAGALLHGWYDVYTVRER